MPCTCGSGHGDGRAVTDDNNPIVNSKEVKKLGVIVSLMPEGMSMHAVKLLFVELDHAHTETTVNKC